jgi:prepilin signal peptidase PulO-like enzyme (type II secretory pathway)
VAGALGLIFGSFVTALSYRLPRGESIAHGRSRCPNCGTALTIHDLFPVLSWLLSGGRCRHCGTTISVRYPATEILMLALFVVAALTISSSLMLLALALAMTATMVALAVIDLEHWILPDSLLATLAIFAAAWRGMHDGDFGGAILQGAVLFVLGAATNLVAGRLTKRPGFGMGDTKLLSILGVTLSLGPLLVSLAIATVGGLVMGVIWLRRTRSVVFPFGPAILASLWIGMLFGDRLLGGLIGALR